MRQYRSALIVIVVGALLTMTGYLMVKRWEGAVIEAELIRVCIVSGFTLNSELERHMLLTEALEGLYASSTEISRESFNRFGQSLLKRISNLVGMGWMPRVSRDERAAIEQELTGLGGEHTTIWERNAEGEPVAATDRAEYFPLFLATPFEASKKVFGYDFSSSPEAFAAMKQARDSGNIAITAEIKPAVGGKQESRFLTFMPVYASGMNPTTVEGRRANLTGLLVGSHQIGNIIDSRLKGGVKQESVSVSSM